MDNNRTKFIGVKVSPAKHKEIEDFAVKENRSLSNFLEWYFDNYKEKLCVPQQQDLDQQL